MSKEYNYINMINAIMPKSENQINKVFESDSEIFNLHNMKLAINTDEFSQEDFFIEDNPYELGYNIALGAVSDIIAVGAKPIFFLHSMTINSSWDDGFITAFSKGISDLLKLHNIAFLGGDFGIANQWRVTCTVIGECMKKEVMRIGAKEGDPIYISGRVGKGNLNAAVSILKDKSIIPLIKGKYSSIFNTHVNFHHLIANYGNVCIDTSDGLVNTLNTLAGLNGLGYKIEEIPYIKYSKLIAKISKLPRELLIMGEAGEYEFLFSVEKSQEAKLIEYIVENKIKIYKIGHFTKSQERLIKIDGGYIDFKAFDIRGRDYDDLKIYINEIHQYIEKNRMV
ncbi:AIR synthase related protein [Alkaliphilus peptidifermentans]|uniref:AIR synthase related protein n=1 Tax=Alkaliphilus peptidifermentans TaxID=426129 RepID=UPI000B8422C2|nr:AIR synthase related protein [Alkaliphilus peptidifermentans]